MNRVWKPNVTVAAVVERDGRYLLVEEQTSAGLRFNQPAGHLEDGESLLEAVVRETMEETAHPFTPTALLGIYQWPRPAGDVTYLRFSFCGEVGECIAGRALDDGIERFVWMSPDELEACRERHRSPLVMQCIEDHRRGQRVGLDIIRHYC